MKNDFKPYLVNVKDRMQQNYSYWRTVPMGESFDGRFQPELTPKQMLELGVFGGKYMTDCRNEFPVDWYVNAKLCPEYHDPNLNLFKVNASQSLAMWREKGWIYDDDPRGWFQWYCRYYMGRRMKNEDERQIRRWLAMRRHLSQLRKHCSGKGFDCRRKQRQALLHWGYDSRLV